MTIPHSESISPWARPEAIAIVAIQNGPTCQHCQRLFEPRNSTGGQTQKYCSPACRKSANNSRRPQRLTDVDLISKENFQRLTETPTSQAETPQRLTNVSPTTHEMLAPKPKPEPDFDWKDEDEVIIHDQPTVAVYVNVRNQVVIRSQGDGYWTEDQWVVISRPNLAALISRLQEFERGEL
jgi:hypothetical protein